MHIPIVRILLISLLLSPSISWTQVANDECYSAIIVDDLMDFCSVGYTNRGATPSANGADCDGIEGSDDVWYFFQPRRAGLSLQFIGRESDNSYTLDDFVVSIYEGRCTDLAEYACIRSGSSNQFDRLYTNLIIGRSYFIRVSSPRSSSGTFQLCLNQFNPVPEPQQDCPDGVVLCDKSSFTVEKLENGGRDNREGEDSCLFEVGDLSPSETGSVWYKWTAKTSGSLTFTLTPNSPDEDEDLDFAVYRLPSGLNDCPGKQVVRCMASGETLDQSASQNAPCLGPTGLREGETDIVETRGCAPGDNNFVAPLDMIAGESYALLVNNFSESGFGFAIDFGGTGEFVGPDVEFDIIARDDFSCDKEITFVNNSSSSTDSIEAFSWSFGDRAVPPTSSANGDIDVSYESFGAKITSLTARTSRGCIVTEVKDLEIEPCCTDDNLLQIQDSVTNLTCYQSQDGVIELDALNGSPEYLFSFENGTFVPVNTYGGLASGDYNVAVVDIKGCRDSAIIFVDQPEEISLILSGPTDTLMLGDQTQLTSSYTPLDRILTYSWRPPTGLLCTDCPNPEVIPPGTTTYILEVTDQDGCIQSEEITVYTDAVRPFAAPNVIKLSELRNPANGLFKGSITIAADHIEFISVYDRWGSEIYREENIIPGDLNYLGWDGTTLSGQKVNPGVYVWIAQVRFVDQAVITFKGDLTVID